MTEGGDGAGARSWEPFENRRQVEELLWWLRRRRVPGKFTYVGAAADSHLAYDSEGRNHEVTRNTDLELEVLRRAWGEQLRSVHTVLDLGPGDGDHTVSLLRGAGTHLDWRPSSYVAVDYGERLARHAIGQISAALPDLRIAFVQADLERRSLVNDLPVVGAGTLCLLLGNTIGNVESIPETLRNLRRCCAPGGKIMLTYSLWDAALSAAEHEAPYNTETYALNISHPLVMAGFPRSAIVMSNTYDAASCCVVSTATLAEDVRISLLGTHLAFSAGETLCCFLSRRQTPAEVWGAAVEAGFRVVYEGQSPSAGLASVALETWEAGRDLSG